MYLFSHLCQYLLVDIYFTLWVIIQYCVPYFVVQIVSALAVGDFFSCSCVPLTWPVSVGVLSIPCFMASKLFRPRLVCPHSSLEGAISLGSLGSCYWKGVIGA